MQISNVPVVFLIICKLVYWKNYGISEKNHTFEKYIHSCDSKILKKSKNENYNVLKY